MTLSWHRLRTYRKLGFSNLFAVAIYRLQLRLGVFVRTMPIARWVAKDELALLPEVDSYPTSNGPYSVRYFNDRDFEQLAIPDWFANPYCESRIDNNQSHWSTFPDFDLQIGDVKTVWELSRFDWLIKACWHIRVEGTAPVPINQWLDDWCEHNPVNQGVNWKCAQEASIRAMNMVLAPLILNSGAREFNIRYCEFLAAHIHRILPTISYARAQDNNHGTSEAAALFVVGSVLSASAGNRHEALARRAIKQSRRLLEERVGKLIDDDGVFSQYSVNYHRMMLDTLSFTELMRRHFDAPAFPEQFMEKAQKATRWLLSVTDPTSGDAPNMGTNDGSLLFNCRDADFRDFRPSCELAAAVFLNQSVFGNQKHGLSVVFSSHPHELEEAGLQKDGICSLQDKVQSIDLPNLTNGFKRIGNASTFAILKTPHDRFRPSQADALHLDIWHNGINLVRDAGTYSYNPPSSFKEDLGDTGYHSTVQIDGRNQMFKLGRFLYTNWLEPQPLTTVQLSQPGFVQQQGAYVDYKGASHHRVVSFDGEAFTISDELRGCRKNAIIRFRLAPISWEHSGQTLESEGVSLNVSGKGIVSTALNQSVESRYYLRLSKLPVFEVALSGDSVTTTTLRFANFAE